MKNLRIHIGWAGYGKKTVLTDIDLTVDEGRIIGLIGPNGAGKSTLLKAVVGLVEHRDSTITFNGEAITHTKTHDMARKGLVFVPQGNRVFGELTVAENLDVGGFHFRNPTELAARRKDVLDFFPALGNRLKTVAGKLSGGEKQQLCLGRALMARPEVLMLDEPSLGLAPGLVKESFEIIRKVNTVFKTTILIVEQKVRELRPIVHHVHALKMGQVFLSCPPEKLDDTELMKSVFLVR